MAKIDFDEDWSRAVEAFNMSPGAIARRGRILDALALEPGDHVLDVGCGPGHQLLELRRVVGDGGRLEGVDPAESALEIARNRCAELGNVRFQTAGASRLPFDDGTFDAVMSSQVFEYLDDVRGGLVEIHRVLKPGGRLLIHDTDWGTAVWHCTDVERMERIMKVWDGHLADPILPRTLGAKLRDAGFADVRAEPLVQLETTYEESGTSAFLIRFITDYVASQGVSRDEADAWAADLEELGTHGSYFCSWNEYLFTARRP